MSLISKVAIFTRFFMCSFIQDDIIARSIFTLYDLADLIWFGVIQCYSSFLAIIVFRGFRKTYCFEFCVDFHIQNRYLFPCVIVFVRRSEEDSDWLQKQTYFYTQT